MIIVGGYDDEKCNRQRRKAEQAALAPGFRAMAGRDRQQFTHAYAQKRSLSLEYLIKCLKWHYEACKRKDKNEMVADIGSKPKEFPSLVAVTKQAGSTKPSSSVAEGAIRIRMRASSIDLSGDIAPTLLVQLLSTLGALDVL